MLSIQLFAFVGGLITVALVYFIAKLAKQQDPVLSLVLVGIAISALCGSAISLMKILADPYTQLPSITFWLLGGLSTITAPDLLSVAPLMLLGFIPLILLRWRMNILSLSDELLVGANFGYQLPISLLVGATMLLITDTLARTIANIELPLGILTSAIGAPFFLMLLLKTRRDR